MSGSSSRGIASALAADAPGSCRGAGHHVDDLEPPTGPRNLVARLQDFMQLEEDESGQGQVVVARRCLGHPDELHHVGDVIARAHLTIIPAGPTEADIFEAARVARHVRSVFAAFNRACRQKGQPCTQFDWSNPREPDPHAADLASLRSRGVGRRRSLRDRHRNPRAENLRG